MDSSSSQTAPVCLTLPRAHKSCQDPAPVWAPLSTGLQSLPAPCCSTGFPWGHSPCSGTPCSGTGSSRRCRCISALRALHGCRGPAASPGAAPGNLRAISSSPCSSSCPSCPALGWAELFLSRVLTLLFPAHCCNHTIIHFLFLKSLIPKVLPPFPTGPALASGQSILELAGIDSVGQRSSCFRQPLTEGAPRAPPLPKPGHANLV